MKKILDYKIVKSGNSLPDVFNKQGGYIDDLERHIRKCNQQIESLEKGKVYERRGIEAKFKNEAAKTKHIKKELISLNEEIEKLQKAIDEDTFERYLNFSNALETKVLKLVELGYEPLGGIGCTQGVKFQAMVKYEK